MLALFICVVGTVRHLPPLHSVGNLDCAKSPEIILITSSRRPIPGTLKLWMRFDHAMQKSFFEPGKHCNAS